MKKNQINIISSFDTFMSLFKKFGISFRLMSRKKLQKSLIFYFYLHSYISIISVFVKSLQFNILTVKISRNIFEKEI